MQPARELMQAVVRYTNNSRVRDPAGSLKSGGHECRFSPPLVKTNGQCKSARSANTEGLFANRNTGACTAVLAAVPLA